MMWGKSRHQRDLSHSFVTAAEKSLDELFHSHLLHDKVYTAKAKQINYHENASDVVGLNEVQQWTHIGLGSIFFGTPTRTLVIRTLTVV